MLKSRQYPSLLCCQTHQDLTPNKWLPGQRRQRQETVFRGGISLRRSELLDDGVVEESILGSEILLTLSSTPRASCKMGTMPPAFNQFPKPRKKPTALLWPFAADFSFLNKEAKHHHPAGQTDPAHWSGGFAQNSSARLPTLAKDNLGRTALSRL